MICLLIAALIGFVLGWLLRGLSCHDSDENIETRQDGFSNRSVSNSSSLLSSESTNDSVPEPITRAPKSKRKRDVLDDSVTPSSLPDKEYKIETPHLSAKVESTSSKVSEETEGSDNLTIDTSTPSQSNKDFSDKNLAKNTLSSASLLSNKESAETIGSFKQPGDDFPEPITKAPAISHKIEKIEGIGKSLGNKIRKAGAKTTKDLLKVCSTASGLQQVMDATQVTKETATQWVSMAGLMQVKGVDGQIAELMLAAGVNSPEKLATMNPQTLTAEMVKVNQRERKIPASIELPSVNNITEMVNTAKHF
jgi:hypothetical protein